jgi:hypothetical protein
MALPGSTVTIGAQNVKLDFVRGSGGQLDVGQPTARLESHEHRRKSTLFEVVYRDDEGMDAASLGRGDVRVVSAKGWSRRGRLISAEVSKDGRTIRAVYRVRAPGAWWDPGDNGRYEVHVGRQQVLDSSGNVARARGVGGFGVKLDRALFSKRQLIAAGMRV